MATTYCQHADVSDLMQRSAFLASGSVPTIAQVEKVIQAAEDEVDRYTNTAWRSKTVTNEYHDYKGPRLYNRPVPTFSYFTYDVRDYRMVPFRYAPIMQINGASGDKIEIWRGNAYEDIVSTGQEGRDKDWWVDYERGELYFVRKYPLRERNGAKLTYRYGASSIPNDVRQATVLITMAYLLMGSVGTFLLPEGGSEPGYQNRAQFYMDQAHDILDRYWNPRADYI